MWRGGTARRCRRALVGVAGADTDLWRRQCEARHFIHLYMQHLSIVVWKFEPAEEKSA